MMACLRYCAFQLILIAATFIDAANKITYISVEHPRLNYFNPKYIDHINMTTIRYGRSNPIYYVNLHFMAKVYFANNVTINFYFYELLTNRYQRSFVEMHFKFCDLIHKDPWFGAAMKQGDLDRPCPYPPQSYHLYNMSIPSAVIPNSFPFRKGRIYANLTLNTDRLAELQIDMELKQLKVKKVKN